MGPTVRTVEAGDTVLFSPDTRLRGRDPGRGVPHPARARRARGRLAPERGRHGALPVIDPATALRIDGRAVLVTGGTRGIGRAIAEACAAAGADICVVARKPAELDETEAALVGAGRPGRHRRGLGRRPRGRRRGGAHDDRSSSAAATSSSTTPRSTPSFAPLMDADLGAVTKVFDANIAAPAALRPRRVAPVHAATTAAWS